MATFLWDSIAYGPVHSRRLGLSLGVNLLPVQQKVCSFQCIYCECGYTQPVPESHFPTREEVRQALHDKLQQLQQQGLQLDVFTFAGNGEPTLHPQFPEIIEDTILLRNQFFPSAKISVLSNATQIGKDNVFKALQKVDNNILKLDSGIDATARLMDAPASPSYSVAHQIELMQRFNGNFIMQTIFLRGSVKGVKVDNTTPAEVDAWTEAVRLAHPKEVMVYQVDRDTPVPSLEKISNDELFALSAKVRQLGIKVQVA